jgi:NADH dehydrogenase
MILVAGGTGFVGAGIVRELARRGRAVAVLTRDPARNDNRFPGLDVELRPGDVTRAETLSDVLQGVDTIIGCQQFPNSPIENPGRGYTFEEVDARGTENLVTAARASGVRRYIYISGAGAAPDASSHWFRAKWRAESAVRDSGMTHTIIRPSWVYGPEDRSLNRFLGMSRVLPFVPLIGAAGRQRLQPVFVDDVARAAAAALENEASHSQVFEIGGPQVLTMKEIVATALNVTGRRRLLISAPKGVMKLAASVLQFMPGRPLTPDAVDFITEDAVVDPRPLASALGVQMTPLRYALSTYLAPAATGRSDA